MCESRPAFDLTSRNQKNQTVLDFAIEKNHHEAVDYFVTHHSKRFNRLQLQAAQQFLTRSLIAMFLEEGPPLQPQAVQQSLERDELLAVDLHKDEEKPRPEIVIASQFK